MLKVFLDENMRSHRIDWLAFFAGIQDVEGGIVLAYGGHSRLHLFMAPNHHEIIQAIVHQCNQSLGMDIKVLPTQITLNQFEKERFGEYQSDQHQTSLSEFIVKKISPRHFEPPKRILCLTETTLLERDPQTYNICTLRPLTEIFALIRSCSNIQMFGVEYKSGDIRTYTTNDRWVFVTIDSNQNNNRSILVTHCLQHFSTLFEAPEIWTCTWSHRTRNETREWCHWK